MEAYEAAYNEARKVLHQRGKKVGLPVQGEDGLRRCPVGGTLLLDHDLLKEAWGESLADEILCRRVEAGSVPLDCPDCVRFWVAFCVTTRPYLRAFSQHQMAASGDDLIEKSTSLKLATDRRQGARTALMEHAATHRGTGSANA
jgi:hypothetical protein